MDRRIRVKCPECAASIEMRVDQQELLDVTCPRCQKPFTAKVPPLALDILPVIESEPEPEEARPAVKPTRVVEQTRATRPRRIREIPQRSASKPTVAPASFEDTSWQLPTAHYQPGTPYQPAPRVSGATHVKAFLIAGASVLGVGLLVMFGFMIKSVVSNIDFSSAISSTDPVATPEEPVIVSPSPSPTEPTPSVASTVPTASNPSVSGPKSPVTPTGVNGMIDQMLPPPSKTQQAAPAAVPASSAVTSVETPTVKDKVTELATQYLDATKDLDGEFLLDRTHPKLIEQVGGRATMLERIQNDFAPLKKSGVTVISYKVSELVNVRQVGQNIFVVLPTELKINESGRVLRSDRFLLGVSEDGGKTFVFIDGPATTDRGRLKQILPQMPDDLALPAISAPREVAP